MCPLDSAKTDSLWAIRSRSSWLSVRTHGSTPYGSVSITDPVPPGGALPRQSPAACHYHSPRPWTECYRNLDAVLQEFRQVLHDHVGAVRVQLVGLPDPVHADDEAEAPRLARRDTGQRVLVDDGAH